jgi:hypothetical protein
MSKTMEGFTIKQYQTNNPLHRVITVDDMKQYEPLSPTLRLEMGDFSVNMLIKPTPASYTLLLDRLRVKFVRLIIHGILPELGALDPWGVNESNGKNK